MEWHHYFSAFLAGAFASNFAPHFIKGVAGDKFPSPFSRPMGKGLSSPTTNVIWALINLLIGYLLYRFAQVSSQDYLSLILFFAGFSAMSIRGKRKLFKKEYRINTNKFHS
jgi:hypothetical protein